MKKSIDSQNRSFLHLQPVALIMTPLELWATREKDERWNDQGGKSKRYLPHKCTH